MTPALPRRWLVRTLSVVAVVCLLALLLMSGFWLHLRSRLRASMAPVSGTIAVRGLQHPVTVRRDPWGVPHIEAASLHDLLFAQGWVTASDRLWQMDMARRLPAGEAAEVLGSALVDHDRVERTLGIRDVAARLVATMPPDQLAQLQNYADGVNAYIAHGQLPAEFSLLDYSPQAWRPVDSALVALSMSEMLDERWQAKLKREQFTAQMIAHHAGALVADLYPVGSWRDHPPVPSEPGISDPQVMPQIPLDASQLGEITPPAAFQHLSAIGEGGPCTGCRPGSNEWAVSGAHTASGMPLLANDMHLEHGIPDLWYEADLLAPGFHAAGVTVPGLPWIAAGHNDHIAWGFTAMGGDTQDLYVEKLNDHGQYQKLLPSGQREWLPLSHERETIRVRWGANVKIDVERTDHGPIMTPVLPGEQRTLALHWTLYDPAVRGLPLYALDTASDWAGFRAALSTWWAPTLNVAYADTAGHIGYQAVGLIPIRAGGLDFMPIAPVVLPAPAAMPPQPGPQPPADTVSTAIEKTVPTTPQVRGEWTGYIPFDQMPSILDPESGIVATANARITPNGYPYQIALDWAAPYRNERIWQWLGSKAKLAPADMLTLQTDVYSASDQELAQRLAYAVDHAGSPGKRARAAANILRAWDGVLGIHSAGAALVTQVEKEFWPAVLAPRVGDAWHLYDWSSSTFAREQLMTNQPIAWLPPGYKDWNNFLTGLVEEAVHDGPKDLAQWQYGTHHTITIKHPLWQHVPGIDSGVGPLPQSGDPTTVKQVLGNLGPSQRFTADLSNLDRSTENLVMGESGDPVSLFYRNQWPYWYNGRTFPLPYTPAAVRATARTTLRLVP